VGFGEEDVAGSNRFAFARAVSTRFGTMLAAAAGCALCAYAVAGAQAPAARNASTA
jgi:hypothetical protein